MTSLLTERYERFNCFKNNIFMQEPYASLFDTSVFTHSIFERAEV